MRRTPTDEGDPGRTPPQHPFREGFLLPAVSLASLRRAAALLQRRVATAAQDVGDQQGDQADDDVLDRPQRVLAVLTLADPCSEKTISRPAVMLVR